MLKDATINKAHDIAIGVVNEENDQGERQWNVYFMNLKQKTLEGVLVSSRGYGTKDDEEVKTTQLRHFLDEVPPESYRKVEPIMEELFGLNNQYWVSYFLDGKMYEKRYVILPESIKRENFVTLPLINLEGVLLQ